MINRKKTLEFHFVVNIELKKKLIEISKLLNLNLSKTIIFIIHNISVLLNKLHLIYKEENNKVEKINWNCHIHLYLNEKNQIIYNKLKSIHKDNNSYSIACKLRYLLKIFMRGVDLFGFEKFLNILKNSEKKWGKIISKQKFWRNFKKVRQLSCCPYLNVLYDQYYSVISIKLLN
ncbi:MAG: hypothetical protein JXB50_13920 [Spirochaetes bacterium]|nr:hypothetical protein [Spirochaetota bacterium]